MRLKVTMKDPDTLHEAVTDAVRAELKAVAGISDAERRTLEEGRVAEEMRKAGRWFDCGEYLTVEIDTDAGTAVVCPAE